MTGVLFILAAVYTMLRACAAGDCILGMFAIMLALFGSMFYKEV